LLKLLSWILGLIVLCQTTLLAGPALVFKEEILRLPAPASGQSVTSGTFEFENRGSAPIRVKSVASSCSCTRAVAPQEPVEPGAQGKIPVSFDASGRSGPQRKRLVVQTEDAQKYILTIVIELPSAPTATK
jgi:hypothetical protein